MKRLIKIYGERNTGTNYLAKIIELNLSAALLPGIVPPLLMKLQNKVPYFEQIRDLYFTLTYSRNLGWKHTVVKNDKKLSRYKKNNTDLCFLTITKNPYSWLLSLYKRPYHFTRKSYEMSFEYFLKSPWRTLKRENAPKVVPNPIELWNLKNSSYLGLLNERTLNITSEILIENPDGVINNVCEKFGIPKLQNHFINFEASTKDKTKNTDHYRKYYLNEMWRSEISEESLCIINRYLDFEVLEHFGYEIIK